MNKLQHIDTEQQRGNSVFSCGDWSQMVLENNMYWLILKQTHPKLLTGKNVSGVRTRKTDAVKERRGLEERRGWNCFPFLCFHSQLHCHYILNKKMNSIIVKSTKSLD